MPEWGSPDHARSAWPRSCGDLEDLPARRAARARRFARGTTHVSVADGEGNVAAMCTTNGESAGYVVPGPG